MTTPLSRIEKLVGLERRALIAKLSESGYCFLARDVDPHYEALAVTEPGADAEAIQRKLGAHAILHALGHNLGLLHNFEGSSDALDFGDGFWLDGSSAYASVMDVLSGEQQARAGSLGRYDVAALRYAYKDELEVFTGGEALSREAVRDLDYHRLNELTDAGARTWVAASAAGSNIVPYTWCNESTAYLAPSVFCRAGDRGASAREILASLYEGWASYYPWTNSVRPAETFTAEHALDPAVELLGHASVVAQQLHRSGLARPGYFATDQARDLISASALALNFASEVIATPEPGQMCPWPGTLDPVVYLPEYFLADCSTNPDMIEVPLGEARPAALAGEPWNLVGSYFDRQNILWMIGLLRPATIEGAAGPERRASLYHLFAPELRGFYESLLHESPYFVSVEEAQKMGSFHCGDGRFEPRRLIDAVDGTANPGASARCGAAAVINPLLPESMMPNALVWSFGLFTDPSDPVLDLAAGIRIYQLGVDDRGIDWSTTPFCSVTNMETSAEYRAIGSDGDLPCMFINRATDAQNDMLSNGMQVYREISRRWFGYLDLARELRASFMP